MAVTRQAVTSSGRGWRSVWTYASCRLDHARIRCTVGRVVSGRSGAAAACGTPRVSCGPDGGSHLRKLSSAANFGAIDADADDLLGACFQNHHAYLDARDFKSFLILGRKGSGKTAIYKRLITEHDHQHFAYGHSFDDYPWQHHDLQAEVGVPEERRYFHSWKYLVLIGLSKLLLNRDQSQPWGEKSYQSLLALEAFVVDSYGTRDPDLRQLFSPTRELKVKSALKLPFLEISGETLKVRDLPLHVQDVNRAIQDHVLNCLNPDFRYYVCFDQLDLGFDKSPLYQQRLIGLILAARELFLAARIRGVRLNVVVFLRDDIYQDLHFEDKNKVTDNFVSTVLWSESAGELTLKSLMESRFNEVLRGEDENHVRWEDVFDEAKEMPSRQSKYRHICDRTFLRPRDMIKFCNEVLSSLKESEKDVGKFENSAIISAREAYSDYLLNELDDEISKHVPGYKDYLEVVKDIGTIQFGAEAFESAWKRRRPDDGAVQVQSGLEQLFEFSVIGYLRPGGRSGGSEYVWRYRDPRARFNPGAEVFRVHPGFKEALDLARGR